MNSDERKKLSFDFNEPGVRYKVIRGNRVVGTYTGDGTDNVKLPGIEALDSLGAVIVEPAEED